MSGQKPTLSLLDTTLIVSGSMIGSGIFIVSSEMARTVGSSGWLLVCWVLTGVLTLFAALSYGELAGMMPKAGGQYVYIKKAFGSLIAFMYGWTVFLVIQTGVIAAVAVAFAKYIGVFIPLFEEGNIFIQISKFKITYAQLLAIISIAFLTFINARGIKNGKIIQRIFTFAKLIALFGLIIIGLYAGFSRNIFSENFTDAWNASFTVDGKTIPLSGIAVWIAVGVAMIGSLFSSDAWNNVTFIAAEIKNPQKNIPMGLMLGTFIVTVIYCLANVAYLCLLPIHEIQNATHDRVGAAAMATIFNGNTAMYLMAGLIVISTFGCNNGLIMAGARLFQAMSVDDLFFKGAKETNKFGVPGYALVIQAVWACLLCLSGSYGDLLEYSTFASLLFYIVTITAIFVLRKKEPETPRPYKAWGYPLVPALYILLTTLVCVDLVYNKTLNTGIGLIIVALGIPVYYIMKSGNRA
ncbi:MAG TPA: amino acid permease [Bacteroidia bacterium]|jgi:APA family basic amino acid/polyamine antiporter|nr:amino acid permease [Bacteroidia bacterium]